MLTTAYWACSVLGVGLAIAAVVRYLRGLGERRGVGLDRASHDDLHRPSLGSGAEGVSAGGLGSEVAGDTLDMSEEMPIGPSAWDRWFSMRFWYGAIAVFGLLGVWLTYDSSLTASATFWIAVSSGLVFGQTLHQIGRMFAPEPPMETDSADD